MSNGSFSNGDAPEASAACARERRAASRETYFTEKIVDKRFFRRDLPELFQFGERFLVSFEMQQETRSEHGQYV